MLLKNLAEQFTQALPPSLQHVKEEVDKHCHQWLTKTLGKMDIVTREEFDIQTQVLAKTRDKLEKLEKLVDNLLNSEK